MYPCKCAQLLQSPQQGGGRSYCTALHLSYICIVHVGIKLSIQFWGSPRQSDRFISSEVTPKFFVVLLFMATTIPTVQTPKGGESFKLVQTDSNHFALRKSYNESQEKSFCIDEPQSGCPLGLLISFFTPSGPIVNFAFYLCPIQGYSLPNPDFQKPRNTKL